MWQKRVITLGFLVYFLTFWFVFSGIFSAMFITFAVASVLFSFYIGTHFFFHKDECIIFPSFGFLKYLAVITRDIVASSLYVIGVIIKSKGNIPEPEIEVITLKIKNPHVRSFIENSISLTPGTFVIHSSSTTLLASAIDKETMKNLVNRRFISSIYTIFKKFNFDH